MKRFGTRQALTIVMFGLLGWALCGAIMFVGMAVTSMQTTLTVHAIGAPIIFAVISWIYFSKTRYTSALTTAIAFVGIVIFMDFFLVSLIINRSLEMFSSIVGTWLPFVLIFLSTYLTGKLVEGQSTTDFETLMQQ